MVWLERLLRAVALQFGLFLSHLGELSQKSPRNGRLTGDSTALGLFCWRCWFALIASAIGQRKPDVHNRLCRANTFAAPSVQQQHPSISQSTLQETPWKQRPTPPPLIRRRRRLLLLLVLPLLLASPPSLCYRPIASAHLLFLHLSRSPCLLTYFFTAYRSGLYHSTTTTDTTLFYLSFSLS